MTWSETQKTGGTVMGKSVRCEYIFGMKRKYIAGFVGGKECEVIVNSIYARMSEVLVSTYSSK